MIEMTHSFLPHGVAPFGLIGFQQAAGQSNMQSKRSKPTPPLLINIRPIASCDYCWLTHRAVATVLFGRYV